MAGCYFFILDFLFLCYLWGAWLQYNTDAQKDGCKRAVKFLPPETGQYLEGHLFINVTIGIYTACEHRCVMERKCVSVNIGPTIKDKVICELSDSDHLQHPDDLKPRPGWTFRGTENLCYTNPCRNNGTCVMGYTEKKYLCECAAGFTGENCEIDADECVLGIHTCSLRARCVNIPGSFQCRCKIGYTGNGLNCTAVPLTCVIVTHSAATNSYEVNANHTTTHALCRVIRMEEVTAGDPYTLTVDLFNVIGWGNVNVGHPGVMYNVIDGNNFDYVYFRPHSTNGCYQIGYLLNGNVGNRRNGHCPNGPPPGANWFTVRLVVGSDKTVNIFLNNALVTTLVAQFDTRGHGGVFVFNGHQNIIKFRAFSITTTQ